MGLSAGTHLGPYEIISLLGAGGMGEVYKARDTRLERTVAIKILPEALASDAQFRERFDREARLISQLDHPHICTLYDVGRQDGTAYLVMQFLEGETLAERLAKGPLPLAQALEHATQIADALTRAHRTGIIHRDLKPGNIMLTKSGARLLDFGLAKSGPAVSVPAAGGSVQTVAANLTAQGTIIGTFQYMAPEQVEGGDADARSDVWAFGCVLYEMLTGTRPFSGKSPASLLANILASQPPPLRERQPLVTSAIDHVVRRCLEKDPDRRWQSMADVGHELRWAASAEDARGGAARPLWRQPLVYVAAIALLVAAGAVARMLRAPAAAPLKVTLVPPAGLTFTPFGSNGIPHFALSPDGQRIAFVASAAGRAPCLWIRRLDSRAAQAIADSDDASAPFWSADGQSLGFFAEGKVKTIALQGERPKTLATIIDAAGGAWHGDVILVGRTSGAVVRLAAAGGGGRSDATALRSEVGGHRWPQFLPDGRHFMYTESLGAVRLGQLDSTAAVKLVETDTTAVYAPSGHLLFVRTGTLIARALDRASFVPIGDSRVVLEQVRYGAGSGYPPVSVSANGLLAYWDGTTVSTEPQWFDRRGNRLATLPVPSRSPTFAISPVSGQVAFTRSVAPGDQGRRDIWIMEPSGAASRFSFGQGGATRPIWSADGRHILFTSGTGSNLVLMRRAVNGAETESAVGTVAIPAAAPGIGNYYATDWSKDGRTALLSVSGQATARDIAAFSVDSGRLTPLFHSAAYEIQARFSPDNRWIAYVSNETGRWEVFVETFPASGSRWQVSTEGGSQPVWRRDGKELFFLGPDGKLMAVAVTPGGTFTYGKAQRLFESGMRPTYAPYPVNYDVTPDGQRFLIDAVRPDTGPTISLIVNWTAGGSDR